jgi:hypothetical protein
MRILLGTPAYGGMVTLNFHNSVLDFVIALATRRQVSFERSQKSLTSIPEGRNQIATEALLAPSITHLLFVDADIGGFTPSLIEKMLDEDKPVVGAVYPKRQLPLTFVPEPQHIDLKTRTKTGFARAPYAGSGLMLIKREALVTIREKFPNLWAEGSKPLFQCFSPIQDSNTNRFYHDDISFCLRWTHGCGGEVWVCIDEKIDHTGPHTVEARYSDTIS